MGPYLECILEFSVRKHFYKLCLGCHDKLHHDIWDRDICIKNNVKSKTISYSKIWEQKNVCQEQKFLVQKNLVQNRFWLKSVRQKKGWSKIFDPNKFDPKKFQSKKHFVPRKMLVEKNLVKEILVKKKFCSEKMLVKKVVSPKQFFFGKKNWLLTLLNN